MAKKLGPGDDATMISDPDKWPCWPYLPVKRWVNYEMECCILCAVARPMTICVLYKCFLFMLPPTKEEFLKTKAYDYPTIEAMLADGWVVD